MTWQEAQTAALTNGKIIYRRAWEHDAVVRTGFGDELALLGRGPWRPGRRPSDDDINADDWMTEV